MRWTTGEPERETACSGGVRVGRGKSAKSPRGVKRESSKTRARDAAFEKNYEALLGPILLLLQRAGPCSQQELAARLDRMLADREPTCVRERVGVRVSQALGTALSCLRGAGLLELGATVSITDAGRRFHEGTGGKPTLEQLRVLPAFVSWQETLQRDEARRELLARRFQCYVAGRQGAQAGLFLPSGMLLAYAFEYHLKALFAERGERKNGHDLVALLEDCRAEGWFLGTRICRDFLRYASDHFEMRYPSAAKAVLDAQGTIRSSTALLHTYDDAMIQLDLALAEQYGDASLSMGALALYGGPWASRASGDAFFRGNVHAVGALERYRQAGRPSPWFSEVQLVQPDALYESGAGRSSGLSFQLARTLLEQDLARWFVYAKGGEPDADPARLLGAHRSGTWVPERARRLVAALEAEFGAGRVEVATDSTRGDVTVRVFDRSAAHWWFEIPVERERLTEVDAAAWSAEAVEERIARIRKSFRPRRVERGLVSERERAALLGELERMSKTSPYRALKAKRATEDDLQVLRTAREHFRWRAAGWPDLPEEEREAMIQADRDREAHEARAFAEGWIPPWLSGR